METVYCQGTHTKIIGVNFSKSKHEDGYWDEVWAQRFAICMHMVSKPIVSSQYVRDITLPDRGEAKC